MVPHLESCSTSDPVHHHPIESASTCMEQLPDDMLADVLRRLPPGSLAASRCVGKRWCAIIDARRLLLRADLLPLRLDGFFCTSLDSIERLTYFFARPSTARRIPGSRLDFMLAGGSNYHLEVKDHCNGLLLVCDMVVNPATRQWADLPASPEPSIRDMLGGVRVWDQDQDQGNDDHLLYTNFHLVYDPMAESPQHFEVFLIPSLARDLADNRENITIDLDEQQWPPSTLRIHVFSSRRWRWEERSWVRQGEPAGTMADMLQSDCWGDPKAVYFRGALYVQCQNDSVMRIALSNANKYQMMRSPATGDKLGEGATFYLGKSEKGVYCALHYSVDCGRCHQFQVWFLNEEGEENDHIHMEWVLKTNMTLPPLLATRLLPGFADDAWRVIRNYNNNNKEEVPPAAAHGGDEIAADDEWDFDNDDIIVLDEPKDNKLPKGEGHYHVDFLGFHPYKEIVFFSVPSGTISYNLNSSKFQRLGYNVLIPVGLSTCFPYTPCWIRGLCENSP